MGNKQSGGVYTEGDAARSYYSERPVHVTIHNNCTSSVHIYWVDFEGNAVPFMTAKPGQQSEMRTFEAHLWRVVSEDHGEPLGDYVATADMQQDVFIGDARSAKKLAASSAASDALSMISDDSAWMPGDYITECAVCIQRVRRNGAAVTSCGHVFCEACLKTALARYSACPRCQKANPGYTKLFL